MDARATARSLSGGRVAVGAACLAATELTTRVWIGDDAGRTGARLLAPALGAREVVLGAAAHAAPGRGAPVRPWTPCRAARDAVALRLRTSVVGNSTTGGLRLTPLDRLPRGAAVLVRALAGNTRLGRGAGALAGGGRAVASDRQGERQ